MTSRSITWLPAAALGLLGCNFYLPDELSHPDEVPVETGSQPPECQVASIDPLPDCAEPDLSPDELTITCARTVDDTYELFLMDVDGGRERCLTCDDVPEEIAGRHKGNPEFSADGRFLVFMSENEFGNHAFNNGPGIGGDNDFWAVELDSGVYTRLTNAPEGSALQWPFMSRDGLNFVWSQRYERGRVWNEGNEFGRWNIHIVDFTVADGTPSFTNLVKLQPAGPEPYYEPHDFSMDRSKLLLSANIEPGQPQPVLDIYTYDLDTGDIVNLTNSPLIHDEMSVYSPSGNRIAVMSGPFAGVATMGYKADLYLMDANGENFARLTHYNDSEDPSYPGGASQLAQAVWTSDGTGIIFSQWIHSPTPYAGKRMHHLHFEGACGQL